MGLLQKLSDVVFAIERILVIILMTIMLSSLFIEVLFRYVFNSPLSWPEELAIYTLVWITFIGGSMGIKRQQAAAVTFVFDRLPPKVRRFLLYFGFTLIAVFCAYVVYLSVGWLSSPSVFMQKSPSLGIAKFYPYLAVPIGFACMGVHSLNFLVQVDSLLKQ